MSPAPLVSMILDPSSLGTGKVLGLASSGFKLAAMPEG